MFDQIGDPSLSEGIGRRFMTPGGAVAPGLAPEIMPVVVLENDRPENKYLEGSGLYARAVSVAAAVGFRSSVQLINYTADTLVIVERCSIAAASGNVQGGVLWYGPTSAPPGGGTSSRGNSRDSRAVGPSGLVRQSAAYVYTDNTNPILTFNNQISEPSPLILTVPYVLGPYSGLYLCASADNVAISQATLMWRERKLNPSER